MTIIDPYNDIFYESRVDLDFFLYLVAKRVIKFWTNGLTSSPRD